MAVAIGLMRGVLPAAHDDLGKILRPANNSFFESGPVDLIATAPAGKLKLDGFGIQTEQPPPDVLHATLKPSPGTHSLVLLWEGGMKEVHFSVSSNPPPSFELFHQHPPVGGVECTQCHGLNRRGRFVATCGLYSKETVCKICYNN